MKVAEVMEFFAQLWAGVGLGFVLVVAVMALGGRSLEDPLSVSFLKAAVFWMVAGLVVHTAVEWAPLCNNVIRKTTPEVCNNVIGWRDYRKRPVVVQARLLKEDLEVETLEGTMRGRKGDYLIRGIKGEYYPCKPDIFLETYDPLHPVAVDHPVAAEPKQGDEIGRYTATFEFPILASSRERAAWKARRFAEQLDLEFLVVTGPASQNGVFCDKSPGGKA